LITYSPDLPRAGNELLIAVTSARPHPYGRLAGTEKTTFVRERPGQKGYVWEWTVQLTHAAKHEYTFYVDSTIPCKKLEVQVRSSLATKTPTPTKTATPYGWNGNDNNGSNNGNSNDNNNNAIAPRINPASYVVAGQDLYNCTNFESQYNAQSVLRYDASDPNRLDAEDGVEDGIACTTFNYSNYPNDDDYNVVSRVYATATATLVPTATITPTPKPFAAVDFVVYVNGVPQDAYSCGFFAQAGRGQYQAQAVLRADPRDPNKLDSNRDGYACGGVEAAADGVAGGFMPGPFDQAKVPRP